MIADRIPVTATLTQPLHHGAGHAGNTALLRTEEVVQPDGSQVRVPFVSGNSVRHGLRAALAWHAATVLGIPDGQLGKGVVDLLWSGGAVTTTGSETNLELSRRVEALFPALGLLGYAARSDIYAGTLRVAPLILVCRENAWRLPADLAACAHASRGAAGYRDEAFGTRHDVAGTPVDRYISVVGQSTGTTQMIYDMQVLKPGSILCGEITLTPAATQQHRRVLGAALAAWAPGGVAHLGAMSAAGYGAAKVGIPDTADDLDWWTGVLAENRDAVLGLLAEVAG